MKILNFLRFSSFSGKTPVMIAADYGHDKTMEVLAEAGADMTIKDTEGRGEKAHVDSRCRNGVAWSVSNTNTSEMSGDSTFTNIASKKIVFVYVALKETCFMEIFFVVIVMPFFHFDINFL